MFKKGVPSRVIMAITGHKTERAFSSYIKITNDENAQLMLRYLNAAEDGILDQSQKLLPAQNNPNIPSKTDVA